MTITAKYNGTCRQCGASLPAGSTIEWSRDRGARCAEGCKNLPKIDRKPRLLFCKRDQKSLKCCCVRGADRHCQIEVALPDGPGGRREVRCYGCPETGKFRVLPDAACPKSDTRLAYMNIWFKEWREWDTATQGHYFIRQNRKYEWESGGRRYALRLAHGDMSAPYGSEGELNKWYRIWLAKIAGSDGIEIAREVAASVSLVKAACVYSSVEGMIELEPTPFDPERECPICGDLFSIGPTVIVRGYRSENSQKIMVHDSNCKGLALKWLNK